MIAHDVRSFSVFFSQNDMEKYFDQLGEHGTTIFIIH